MLRKFLPFILIIISIIHLIRDILQIARIDTWLTTSLHTNTAYCTPFCDYITLPFEIYIIIVGWLVLRRRNLNYLELSTYIVFLIWMGLFVFSYVYRYEIVDPVPH
jgi:hypothetical protein